jgi:hypothetical protein
MKKIFISMIMLPGALVCFSQQRNHPPENARKSFQQQYPNTQPTQWQQSGRGWSADFDDRTEHGYGEATAHFDKNGRHIDTHITFDSKDVPQEVMTHLHDKYPGSRNYEFTRIQGHDDKEYYRVHFRHKKKDRIIYTDRMGHEERFHDNH